MCISTDKVSMGASRILIKKILNFYKNYQDFYQDFENFYEEFSNEMVESMWIFGEAEKNEKRWFLSKEINNIKKGNFIKIWNNVIKKSIFKKYTEIELRDFLLSNSYDINYLKDNFETEDKLENFLTNLLNFSDLYLSAFKILSLNYQGDLPIKQYLDNILIKKKYTRDDLLQCKTVEDILELYRYTDTITDISITS